MTSSLQKATAVIVIIGVVGFFAWKFFQPSRSVPMALDSFAQCLGARQVTMYGAEWCPHCQNQKKLFGSSFQFVPYVECPKETTLCLQKGITGYPTWIFANGLRNAGEMSLEELSRASGCALPSSPGNTQ